jgi:hypothetical protein
MEPLNLVLWLFGVVLVVVGYTRVKTPWVRYQALREQDANVARYEAWRGGVRGGGETGASVAMRRLRREAQAAGIIVAAGVVLIFLGFLIR